MNESLKDILSNLNTEVDQETLLKYLQGKLSAEEQHEVEKSLLNDPFEAEAVEGLQNIQDKEQIQKLVAQLNRDLKKKTVRKKRTLFTHDAKVEPWLLMTVVFILLLVIIAFLVIYRMKR
jgi:anti-sigma factor RsiW